MSTSGHDATNVPDLATEVAAASWYHTIELPGGVITPGDFDLPDVARRVPFPVSFEGQRCLDVGTCDGFWAFEMERRNASEVMAIDLDDPNAIDYPEPRPRLSPSTVESLERRNSAFYIAHRALGSKVERRSRSVYDLSVDDVGVFDFAFIGTLLLHLRNPVDALAAIRRVLRPGGRLMSNDAVSLPLTLLSPRRPAAEVCMASPQPYWLVPNVAGHRQLVRAAGFEVVSSGGPYVVRRGAAMSRPRHRWLVSRPLHSAMSWWGMLHAWVIARPLDGQSRPDV